MDDIKFVRQEDGKPAIPNVLTPTQINQILDLKEGEDFRSKCRKLYILNKQLYNGGVKGYIS